MGMAITMTCSAALRVVNSKGEHLIAQRLTEPYRGLWQFSGGHIEDGEQPEETAVREALEEIGIKVEIDFPLHSYISYHDGFYCTIFQSKPYDGPIPPNPEPKKCGPWKWADHVPIPRFYGLQVLVERGILRGES